MSKRYPFALYLGVFVILLLPTLVILTYLHFKGDNSKEKELITIDLQRGIYEKVISRQDSIIQEYEHIIGQIDSTCLPTYKYDHLIKKESLSGQKHLLHPR